MRIVAHGERFDELEQWLSAPVRINLRVFNRSSSSVIFVRHGLTRMYFHPLDYVYIAYFNGDAVVLNLKLDQYLILPERLSKHLHTAITKDLQLANGKYNLVNSDLPELPSDFSDSIEALIDAGILSPQLKKVQSSRPLRRESVPGGASNIDWRLSPADIAEVVGIALIAEAYITLIKVYLIIKLSGFYGLIKAIEKRNITSEIVDIEKYRPLVSAVNKAAFYFPVRVKCLEWSATLALMALRRTWRCNMEIGVQNTPFAAHAWVKASDRVIADTQELIGELSVILSEPFQ